jgi:hypothetical protein
MKIIYSYWQASPHYFCDIEMAKTSHDCVKKHGYSTCLYTDKNGYKKLKNVIPYDEIILFDDQILSKLNSQIWSLGKILAMSLVNEPFIHIDFDLFLFKKINDDIIKKDFFALYPEPWMDKIKSFRENISKIWNVYPERNDLNKNAISFNFAVVGGSEYKKINAVCNKILNFSIENRLEIQNINLGINDKINSWQLPVIFEQVMIPSLLLNMFNIENETLFSSYEIDCNDTNLFDKKIKEFLIQNFIEHKIVHLHGNKLEKFKIFKNFM